MQLLLTGDRSVAEHGGGVLFAGKVVWQEAAPTRQTVISVSDVTVTTSTTAGPLLRQQQASVLATRQVFAFLTCNYALHTWKYIVVNNCWENQTRKPCYRKETARCRVLSTSKPVLPGISRWFPWSRSVFLCHAAGSEDPFSCLYF